MFATERLWVQVSQVPYTKSIIYSMVKSNNLNTFHRYRKKPKQKSDILNIHLNHTPKLPIRLPSKHNKFWKNITHAERWVKGYYYSYSTPITLLWSQFGAAKIGNINNIIKQRRYNIYDVIASNQSPNFYYNKNKLFNNLSRKVLLTKRNSFKAKQYIAGYKKYVKIFLNKKLKALCSFRAKNYYKKLFGGKKKYWRHRRLKVSKRKAWLKRKRAFFNRKKGNKKLVNNNKKFRYISQKNKKWKHLYNYKKTFLYQSDVIDEPNQPNLYCDETVWSKQFFREYYRIKILHWYGINKDEESGKYDWDEKAIKDDKIRLDSKLRYMLFMKSRRVMHLGVIKRYFRTDWYKKKLLKKRLNRTRIRSFSIRFRNRNIKRSIMRVHKNRKNLYHYGRRNILAILKKFNPYLWFNFSRGIRRYFYCLKNRDAKFLKLVSKLPANLPKWWNEKQRKLILINKNIKQAKRVLKFGPIVWNNTTFAERNLIRNTGNISLIKYLFEFHYKQYKNCSVNQKQRILQSRDIEEVLNILNISPEKWAAYSELEKSFLVSEETNNFTRKLYAHNVKTSQAKARSSYTQYRTFSNLINRHYGALINDDLHSHNCLLNSMNNFVLNTNIEILNGNGNDILGRSLIKKIVIKRLLTTAPLVPALHKKNKTKLFKWIAINMKRQTYKKIMIKNRYGWFHNKKLYSVKWFRHRLKRWLGRFRKISKDKLFNYLFRNNFSLLTGYNEKLLLNFWSRFRRGSNKYYGSTNLVKRFASSLLLSPANLLLLLRFAPSIAVANSLVKSGNIIVNGTLVSNMFCTLKPGDIVQVNKKFFQLNKLMYSYHQWKVSYRNINYISFLEVDISLLMIFVISAPHGYELIAPKFLSEKWIRYYIFRFPVRYKKYVKPRKAFTHIK